MTETVLEPKKRLKKVYLSDKDMAALEFLSQTANIELSKLSRRGRRRAGMAVGHNLSAAIRYVLARQAGLVQAGQSDPRLAARVRLGVIGIQRKSHLYGAGDFNMDGFTLFMSEADEQNQALIEQAFDLDSGFAAVRFALRMTAEEAGFQPAGGMW